jgi:peptidase M42 family hydrolase
MDKRARHPAIDMDFVIEVLLDLLAIPSPAGFTDEAARYTCGRLGALGIPYELTRRGAIRADLKGKIESPDRAIVAHLDTIGAMVKQLKDNGRLELLPVGTWSSRFAEGARVTVFTDDQPIRGTILPIMASGHTFNTQIDTLPVSWEHVELRPDLVAHSRADLERIGVQVGDFVAVDPNPDLSPSGFINSRHLDDKAGVAVLLGAGKAVVEGRLALPVDCHFLFTISEEVGSGCSAVLHQDVAEMVTIDTGPSAPGQSTDEYGVSICMMDSAGPFDYHLTHHLLRLCRKFDIPHRRDVFRYYRCDSASAIEAGNDIRTALVCFGTDASHGYERCHRRSLEALGELLLHYMASKPLFARDREALGSLEGFPTLPITELPG